MKDLSFSRVLLLKARGKQNFRTGEVETPLEGENSGTQELKRERERELREDLALGIEAEIIRNTTSDRTSGQKSEAEEE